RTRAAGVQHGEYAGLSVGRDPGHLREAGLAQHVHHQITAFRHATVLGGDRRLPDPVLQAPDRFLVSFFNLFHIGCSSDSPARVTRGIDSDAAPSAAILTKSLRFIGFSFLLRLWSFALFYSFTDLIDTRSVAPVKACAVSQCDPIADSRA